MWQRRHRSLAAFLCLVLLAPGCRRDGKVQIGGRITFDSAPVETGTISFLPTDGNGPTAGAVITGGIYKVNVMPGKKTIKIDGYKIIGQTRVDPSDPASPMAPETEPIVPAKYNSQTTLTVDVKTSTSEMNFALRP